MKNFIKSTAAGLAIACSLLGANQAMASESALETVLSTGELKVCFDAATCRLK